MIDFKQFNSNLNDALKANKKLLEDSQRQLNEIESKILQHKDKFTAEQLKAFDDAKNEADRLRKELKKHGVKHTK